MSKDDREIILNRIQTPDGTILTSYHRHDYKAYEDDNGETYVVDGGTSYLRRSMNKEPYIDLTVYDDVPFPIIRRNLHWGTRGPNGNKPLTWKPIRDLDTDHIEAILDLGKKVSIKFRTYLNKELEYRGEQ